MIPIKNLFFILCFFLFISPGCQGKYYPNDRIRVWETVPKFKVFEFVYVLTQGGPSNATQVLGTYIYLQAFNLLHMGYANALSVVLLIIALILGWFQLKASRRA